METYNEQYYHSGCGPIPYEEPAHWVEFFGMIADRIVADFAPKTVLDAGCAMGYLVAALRDRGVDAYGVDISKYAISKVREDIRPFCAIGSLTEELPPELPKHFDLVTNIEVLEHLYAEDGAKAVENLCKLTDTVLFTSTPDDFTEPTHVNVQQREYWARLFAQHGFFDDITYRPKYLTSHAVCYRRQSDILRQVEDYERNIRQSESERRQLEANWSKALENKDLHIQNIDSARKAEKAEWEAKEREALQGRLELEKKSEAELASVQEALESSRAECVKQIEEIQEIQAELSHYKDHYLAAIGQREELKIQLTNYQAAYDSISNAFFWKITKPARVLLDWIKKPLRKVPLFRLIVKGLRCWKQNGFRYTWRKVKNKCRNRQEYTNLATRPLFTPQELAEQRRHVFPRQCKFSIVVPLYNTPENFLREMIQSVLDQTYGDWELCMADGSDEAHAYVGGICRQYEKKDSRIKYRKLEENLGISGNTNACLEMASGDYIGLFDHDDLLHPAALYEVMRAICEKDADFVYTDELTFSGTITNVLTAHFKPDFAPDNLLANNYICHFSVFSREVLNAAGEFRSEYDGSQDHDFILRATGKAKKIVHIPHILYYWRSHPSSVAADINSKTYAIEAGKKAVRDYLKQHGMNAVVESSKAFPTIYRIKYELKETPKVSVIIPNKNRFEDLKKCIESIIDLSTYKQYEIIIVDNQSDDTQVLDYYKQISQREQVRIVYWNRPFNYSAINNYGAGYATGEYLILLNNDTKVITPSWIEEMLMFAQRDDVGAVGAKLYYGDHTIQHAGVILGLGAHRTAGHVFSKTGADNLGYMGRLYYAQDYSAVTAACMMIPKHVWLEVGGLDETFEVTFNDVDLCMRIRQAGYLVVWTPYAELYHYESKSRGAEDTPEKQRRFEGEVRRFQERWKKELAAGDPYYNPNLTLEREDFSIKSESERIAK